MTTPPAVASPSAVDATELAPWASTMPAVPTATALPLDGDAGPATEKVRIYFMLEGDSRSAGLVPVLRDVPLSEPIEAAAVEALLAGPSATEREGSPGITTLIPAETRLLGIDVRDGVATVELSAEFEADGDRIAAVGRIAQVVYALTVYPWIHAVSFTVDGRPLGPLAGGDVILSSPIGRTDPTADVPYEPIFEDVLPEILVDGPSWGDTLYDGSLVQGTTASDGERIVISLYDAAGGQLSEVNGWKPCLGHCRGGFETRIDFTVPEPQWGTLRVAAIDESGVTIPLARDYPVWLISIDPPETDHCGC